MAVVLDPAILWIVRMVSPQDSYGVAAQYNVLKSNNWIILIANILNF